jgi:hypothetical protein
VIFENFAIEVFAICAKLLEWQKSDLEPLAMWMLLIVNGLGGS